ncbi:CocE/NonD family hydrolase C-terminal non-catalytic domain-containing protein [Streptomyces sp. NPDC051677]|uniref:CocE/NonD family hydrolase C-terminal non-catalytic domain-containing protein n=1 Tax=Streptomyces sp. NPDC051677 TaxID=3365669 RepID=UPI0037D1C85E
MTVHPFIELDGIVRVDTVPGEFAEHAVDLWSTGYVFRAGHRLRVHVTSSSFPQWDRNLNTGEPGDRGTDFRSSATAPITTYAGAPVASSDPCRGSAGVIRPGSTAMPHGMPWLADSSRRQRRKASRRGR